MVYVETADDIVGLISGPITHLHDEGKQGMRITLNPMVAEGQPVLGRRQLHTEIERGC